MSGSSRTAAAAASDARDPRASHRYVALAVRHPLRDEGRWRFIDDVVLDTTEVASDRPGLAMLGATLDGVELAALRRGYAPLPANVFMVWMSNDDQQKLRESLVMLNQPRQEE